MGKVKSIILTAIVAAAIFVAAFFAIVPYPVGTIQKYNPIISSIHLGGEFSGYAYTTLYPENVISAREYSQLEDEELEGKEDKTDYTAVDDVYVKNPEEGDFDEYVAQLKADVLKDAEKINGRFAAKGFTSYSVSVVGSLTIQVRIPTNYSYSAYADNQFKTSLRVEDGSAAVSAISSLTVDGRVTFRTTESSATVDETTYKFTDDDYTADTATYSLLGTDDNDNISSLLTSVTTFKLGDQVQITLQFSPEGQKKLRLMSTQIAATESQTLYVFMGTTQMLSVTCNSTFNTDQLQLTTTTDFDTIENIAISLDSALKKGALAVDYTALSTDDIIFSSAPAGEISALMAFIAALIIVIALIVVFFVRYKKLGFVTLLATLVFALVIVYALYLVNVQFSIAVLFTSVIGLMLLSVSNLAVFEEIRRETKSGKTMQSAIKSGYKNTLMTIADMHIILAVVSILLALVGVGEVAACGLILLISVIASYVLYWFTRYFWYVLSAPVRNKFKFCGFKREVTEDD